MMRQQERAIGKANKVDIDNAIQTEEQMANACRTERAVSNDRRYTTAVRIFPCMVFKAYACVCERKKGRKLINTQQN